jgi:hypothetical protein
VVTKGPSDAREDNYNLGIYRMQVLNKNQTIMRWLKHRGGAQHHAALGQGESRAPARRGIVLGADPGIILAAVTPVPETLSEYQFAGLLRGERVVLADCVSQPLKVPAEAEIVIEGEVSLNRLSRRRPLWRSHRLLQFGGAVSRSSPSRRSPCGAIRSIFPPSRTAAGRAVDPGRGAQRSVRAADPEAAISRDRGFLAAAGRLLLSHRRGEMKKAFPAMPSG